MTPAEWIDPVVVCCSAARVVPCSCNDGGATPKTACPGAGEPVCWAGAVASPDPAEFPPPAVDDGADVTLVGLSDVELATASGAARPAATGGLFWFAAVESAAAPVPEPDDEFDCDPALEFVDPWELGAVAATTVPAAWGEEDEVEV